MPPRICVPRSPSHSSLCDRAGVNPAHSASAHRAGRLRKVTQRIWRRNTHCLNSSQKRTPRHIDTALARRKSETCCMSLFFSSVQAIACAGARESPAVNAVLLRQAHGQHASQRERPLRCNADGRCGGEKSDTSSPRTSSYCCSSAWALARFSHSPAAAPAPRSPSSAAARASFSRAIASSRPRAAARCAARISWASVSSCAVRVVQAHTQ